MVDFLQKNVLIFCESRKERSLLFNFFENNNAQMIHAAKNLTACVDLLSSEEINYFIVEYNKGLIESPSQLQKLCQKYPQMQAVVVVNKNFPLQMESYKALQSISDCILFEPLSAIEVAVKLSSLGQQSSSHSLQKPVSVESQEAQDNDHGASVELWDTFFTDTLEAKLIVNAADQKITYVNDALLDLLKCKDNHLIGQSWQCFDAAENHRSYEQYIKEINSQEQTRFVVKHSLPNTSQQLLAQYQMAVLNGEIVFMGVISREDVQGISNQVYALFERIHNVDIAMPDFQILLDDVRKYLGFSFLMFFELENKKLLRPVVVGQKKVVKDLLNQSKESLFAIINSHEAKEIDKNNDRVSQYVHMLNDNNLQSMCVYPIHYEESIYGTMIAGGQNQVDNWQTITSITKAIVSHCRFSLFHKNVIDQQEILGQLDTLTGLPNRNSMTNKLEQIMEKGVSDHKYIALMLVDIEKLNYHNNNLNIDLADEIVLSVSRTIVQSIRVYGQVYRLSEDDFVVLLHPHDNKGLAEIKVKELTKKLSQAVLLSNGKEVKINHNIGISIFPDDGQTVSGMMKNADLAMYDSKMAGKNNYVIFKFSETGKALKQKTEMEENLRIAIEQGHIKVFLQPKIDAINEDIIGFEALVRWIDPEIGMINPGHFIPLAEETGLINEIGEYIARKSCQMVEYWQKKYDLKLSCSINLSAIQLIDKNLPKKLEKIINDSGVHPHYIDFEITETISLDVVPNLVECLNQIVKIGCTLSIDDFGTGHSSLDYIKKIPAKFIKIDQSFVKNIGVNPEDEAILDATINMAKRLNRKIVAEGVETEEQRVYLKERKCDYFQGFLFARPMPEEAIDDLLEQRARLMLKV